MDLIWLEDFLHLCNTGNFRISAGDRFVSQPAFSRRIKSLENWLGAKLIDRKNYPVQPTKVGEEFKLAAEKIVDLAYKARENARKHLSVNDTTLSFGTLNTLAQFFFPRWIVENSARSEIQTYKLRTDFRSVKDYLDGLDEEVIDFYICYEEKNSSFLIDQNRFPSLHLATEYLVPVTKARKDGTPLIWLPDYNGKSVNHLKHTDRGHLASMVTRIIEQQCADIEFIPVFESNIAAPLRLLAIEGQGVTWLPLKSVEPELESGKLVRAGDEFYDIRVDISIFKAAKNTKKKVLDFWDDLRKEE